MWSRTLQQKHYQPPGLKPRTHQCSLIPLYCLCRPEGHRQRMQHLSYCYVFEGPFVTHWRELLEYPGKGFEVLGEGTGWMSRSSNAMGTQAYTKT